MAQQPVVRSRKKKGGGTGKRTWETSAERKAREEAEDDEWERDMEEKCEKFCSRACTIWIVMTPLISVLSTIGEFALRPEMPVPNNPLHGHYAVITGGCGAIGSKSAQMMVEAGANVVIGCRNQSIAEEVARRIRSKTQSLSVVSDEEDDDEVVDDLKGSIHGWELQLGSFQSVRKFASQYKKTFGDEHGLQMLLLNAATTSGCAYTEDRNERVFQVPFNAHANLPYTCT
jgi:hypothetical protein